MSDEEDQRTAVRLARMEERILNTMTTVKQLSDLMYSHYVTKVEFSPVRSIAYGMMGFCGLAVLSAVVGGVIIKFK